MSRKRISCLVVEPNPEAARRIEFLGRTSGILEVRWKTPSLATGREIARRHFPDMAILGLGADPEEAIASIEVLSTEFPTLYLVALGDGRDSGLVLRAMRAGANDFLSRPVGDRDLRTAVEKAAKLTAGKDPAKGTGRIVSVFSAKGGNGTTTIAVNLADAAVRHHGMKVVVVDLVLANGDLTMFFNVAPAHSLLDLARNAEKADYEFLHSLLVQHGSGVYVLADPPIFEEAEQITAAQIREVLSTLRAMFDLVIVDTPHTFDERTLTALDVSDTVLLVTLLNLPALRNTQRTLELFGRIGLLDTRVKLVLSRYLPNDEIPKESIEGILNTPIFFAVPNDYPTVLSSVNRGKLLREIAPDKEVTRSFHRLAKHLLGPPRKEEAATAEPRRGIFGRVFGASRRTA